MRMGMWAKGRMIVVWFLKHVTSTSPLRDLVIPKQIFDGFIGVPIRSKHAVC